MDKSEQNEQPDTNKAQAPSMVQVIISVLSAFFGVQSSKNKERDFKHGNHKVFILVGIGMTLAFLITVITIVQLVINS